MPKHLFITLKMGRVFVTFIPVEEVAIATLMIFNQKLQLLFNVDIYITSFQSKREPKNRAKYLPEEEKRHLNEENLNNYTNHYKIK